jgi:hypothetical protein
VSQAEERLLKLTAERAAERRHHLAWVFSRYVSSQAIPLAVLASELGCSDAVLQSLALCLRPRAERFADDVGAIAAKFDVDRVALARVVRHVEALEAMTVSGKTKRGMLMAARKRRTQKGDKDDDPSV